MRLTDLHGKKKYKTCSLVNHIALYSSLQPKTIACRIHAHKTQITRNLRSSERQPTDCTIFCHYNCYDDCYLYG